MKRVCYISACLLILAQGGFCESMQIDNKYKLTLSDAIKAAIEKNPAYDGARASENAARGLTHQSGLWENPVLFGEVEEYPPEDSFEEARYFFGVSQSIPFPGKKKHDRDAASEFERSRQFISDSARADLVRRVRITFYTVLSAEQLVAVSEKLQTLANSSVETARERLEAGASTAQELLRAEVQAERVKNSKLRFERSLEIARADLALAIGQPDFREVAIAGKLKEEIPERLLAFDREDVLRNHPRIVAAEAMLHRSKALKKRAELEPYPDITLSIAGGRREVSDETLIDFGLSIPLPILDSSRGKVLTASGEHRRAKSELVKVRQTLQTRLSNEIETLNQTAKEVTNYQERLIPLSEKALQMVLTGFREGQYGFNDLLDTQRTVAEAKIEYIQLLLALNTSIAEIRSLSEPKESF